MNNLLSRWNEVLKDMENLVTAVSYDLYIETLEPIKVDKNKLYVLASTSTNKNQLIKLHKEKLLNVAKTHFETIEDVVVLEPGEKEAFLEDIKQNEEIIEANQMLNDKNKLNDKYTFESFVVGKSNQFVYAAARSVAENPGKKYNPLFIYGGVGLGKTHLLHAIGNQIKKNNKNIKILYVTSEQFTNDYIQALKADRKENANKAFRDKYREVDVLMVDDIQFIANKTSTQEEFFHTFNDLYQLDKQIVISSDKHPRNMETLEERLKSRFTGGLIQDIQKPDFETRLAILQKKVEIENYNVDSDVLNFLAEKIDTNIRELEGSLNKVVSLSSLIGKDRATMFEAEEALKDIAFSQSQNLTIDKIMETVCKYYNVKRADLIGKKKNKEIVDPRQICIYLITELLDIPLMTIGNAFGGRDHTTVIHARDKISQNIKTDRSLKTNIDDLIAMIKSDNNWQIYTLFHQKCWQIKTTFRAFLQKNLNKNTKYSADQKVINNSTMLNNIVFTIKILTLIRFFNSNRLFRTLGRTHCLVINNDWLGIKKFSTTKYWVFLQTEYNYKHNMLWWKMLSTFAHA